MWRAQSRHCNQKRSSTWWPLLHSHRQPLLTGTRALDQAHSLPMTRSRARAQGARALARAQRAEHRLRLFGKCVCCLLVPDWALDTVCGAREIHAIAAIKALVCRFG